MAFSGPPHLLNPINYSLDPTASWNSNTRVPLPPTSHPTGQPAQYGYPSQSPDASAMDITPGPDDRAKPVPARATYRCEACNKSYTERRALARHRHSDLHRRNTGLPLTPKYACTTCGKHFNRNHDRQRHENEMHKGLKRSANPKRELEKTPAEEVAESRKAKRSYSDRDSVNMPVQSNAPHFMTANDWQYWNEHSAPIVTPWCTTTATKKPAMSRSDMSSVSPKGTPSSVKAPSETGFLPAPPLNIHAQSWFADESSSEDDSLDTLMKDTPVSQQSLRTISSAGDSAIDMSQDVHEAKYPTITTYDYRQSSEDKSIASTRCTTASSTTSSLVPSDKSIMPPPPLPSRVSIIAHGGKHKTLPKLPKRDFTYCIICKSEFEDDNNQLLAHLRTHLDTLRSENFECETCQIGFAHQADLDMHTSAAETQGNCGFHFEHSQPCTGHHPAGLTLNDRPADRLTDIDAFRLHTRVRHWEQAQLQAYIAEIQRLTTIRNDPRASQAYSVDALFPILRRSRDSMSSFAISIKTYGSAPCDVNADGKTDVGGLQERLRNMTFSNKPPKVSETAKKLPQVLYHSAGHQKGLSAAAAAGDIEKIRKLHKQGASPNLTHHKQSVLSFAAQFSNVETMKTLIKLGANMHSVDAKFGCALSSAAIGGKTANVKYLLDEGVDVNQYGGQFGCPLSTAVARGSIEICDLLISRGANLSQTGGIFHCPISTAVACGNTPMVEYLLRHGVDVNQPGGEEGSPLGYAVWHGHLDMIGLLISRGADVNSAGGKHGGPLCTAIVRNSSAQGLSAIVDYLVEKGADVNRQAPSPTPSPILGSASGRVSPSTPLRVAAARADVPHIPKVIRTLLANGASVHASRRENSPLMMAKLRRQEYLDRKLFPDLIDEEVDIVVDRCNQVISMLRDAGAVDFDERVTPSGMSGMSGYHSWEGSRPATATSQTPFAAATRMMTN